MARPRKDKTTIKNDPFADLIPVPDGGEHSAVKTPPPPMQESEDGLRPEAVARRLSPRKPRQSGEKPADEAAPAPLPPPGRNRQKLTIHLNDDLVNRVKNAAYWNPRLTIARIAERGIRKALEEVERENRGPYPQRESELVGGRPIK